MFTRNEKVSEVQQNTDGGKGVGPGVLCDLAEAAGSNAADHGRLVVAQLPEHPAK